MQDLSESLQDLACILREARHLVIFTGAGVSTPSGIPDYRGDSKQYKDLKTEKRWFEHEPNPAHYAIKELLERGVAKVLISQNVDNLHIKSGTPRDKIIEIHGNSTLMICTGCNNEFLLAELNWDVKLVGLGLQSEDPHPNQPKCPECGGRIISTMVNFRDPIPLHKREACREHAMKADVCLVIGSSLQIHPAASYPKIVAMRHQKLIIINLGTTEFDKLATLKIEADCKDTLPEIVKLL
ncbi:MAG: hypothetical protein INQ03_18640 [Candidatus Heimdallarchaeota archaeon]|nr:hypothetical protein [Candidatus Heimdallarchaeota archaeon]